MPTLEDTMYFLPGYRRMTDNISAMDFASEADQSLKTFRVNKAWRDTRGAGVKVAVLDTGCDLNHPDLEGQVIAAQDFTGSRYGPEDVQGHGSHCAGTIGAKENDAGTIGVMPDIAKEGGGLIIAKVLGDNGSGRGDWIARGLQWAAEQGADIISMSLGSPVNIPGLQQVIRSITNSGKWVICAAGNSGKRGSRSTVNFPGALPETLAVGAVGNDKVITDFSSRGPAVDVCAPGENILSTYPNGNYARLSGTSMACPFVAGVMGLSWAVGNGGVINAPKDLRDFVRAHSEDAGNPGEDNDYGAGLIIPETIAVGEDDPSPDPEPGNGEYVYLKFPKVDVLGSLPGN